MIASCYLVNDHTNGVVLIFVKKLQDMMIYATKSVFNFGTGRLFG